MTRDASELAVLEGRTFAAVLFDMDGTLIDSTPAVERTWQTMADRFGIPVERLANSHGIPARQTLAELVGPDELDRTVDWVEHLEITDTDGVVLLPGAAEALAATGDERGAIATSCTTALMEARVAAAGVPRPAVVVTADQVERGKPDPAPFLLAAQRLGVDPARCLVVEDAPAGIAAGKAAGCTVLAVTTTHDAADLGAADARVATLGEVQFEVTSDGTGVRVTAR